MEIFASLSTKSAVKKAIKKGLIHVNGATTESGKYLYGSETVSLVIDDIMYQKKQIEFKLEVCFEDDHLAIINKPSGIVVSGNKAKTVVNALAFNLSKSNNGDALLAPQPVHRLDFPTSGLLLIGKTNVSVVALNKMFANKEIQKKYHAVCIGEMKTSGGIDLLIDDKDSFTFYKVLKSEISLKYGFLNLVELAPETGRRHQLRKHLAAIGNPILGDKQYGIEGLILQGKGLFLQATSLQFIHPISKKEIIIRLPLPKKFQKIFPQSTV